MGIAREVHNTSTTRSRMRICLLTTSYPRAPGDPTGPFVEGLCRPLVQLGHDVTVVAPSEAGVPREDVLDGVRIRRAQYWCPERGQKLAYGAGIPENLKLHSSAKFQIPFLVGAMVRNAWAIARNSDIIHAHWPLAGMAGVVLKRSLRKKLVVTVHGAGVYTGKYRKAVGYVLEHADFLIYNSTYTRDKCFVRKDLAHEKVIPPGIDTDKFKPSEMPGVILGRYGIPPAGRVVLAIGRLVERKGFEYLVRAMKPVLSEYPEACLAIGGTGPEGDRLRQMAEDMDIEGAVHLLGKIPDQHLASIYGKAAVFVLPAIVDDAGDTEGLGMVTIEAMSCGVPVIGSDVGGIPDVIADGKNGYLVAEKDVDSLAGKIKSVLSNPAIGRQMGQVGRERAQAIFNWQVNAEQTAKVYEGLLVP